MCATVATRFKGVLCVPSYLAFGAAHEGAIESQQAPDAGQN